MHMWLIVMQWHVSRLCMAQVSRAVASRVAVGARALAAVVAAGVGIHLAYLALNAAAVTALRLGGDGPEGALSAAAGFRVICQPSIPDCEERSQAEIAEKRKRSEGAAADMQCVVVLLSSQTRLHTTVAVLGQLDSAVRGTGAEVTEN